MDFFRFRLCRSIIEVINNPEILCWIWWWFSFVEAFDKSNRAMLSGGFSKVDPGKLKTAANAVKIKSGKRKQAETGKRN